MRDNTLFAIFIIAAFTGLIFVGYFENQNKVVVNKQPVEVNQTYQQDSLCRIWVDSTHLRVAFKTWYNNHKGKVK